MTELKLSEEDLKAVVEYLELLLEIEAELKVKGISIDSDTPEALSMSSDE